MQELPQIARCGPRERAIRRWKTYEAARPGRGGGGQVATPAAWLAYSWSAMTLHAARCGCTRRNLSRVSAFHAAASIELEIVVTQLRPPHRTEHLIPLLVSAIRLHILVVVAYGEVGEGG